MNDLVCIGMKNVAREYVTERTVTVASEARVYVGLDAVTKRLLCEVAKRDGVTTQAAFQSLIGKAVAEGKAASKVAEEVPGKTLRRAAEVDAVLDLAPGHTLAETILENIITDFQQGEFGVITEGWNFDNGPESAKRKLAKLVKKWKAEDAAAREQQAA